MVEESYHGISYMRCRKCGYIPKSSIVGKPYKVEAFLKELASGKYI